MNNVIVTGGAGYLGVVLCEGLLKKGYKVTVYDKFYFGNEPLKKLINLPNFSFVKGDILDFDRHQGLLEGVECVVHLAGLSNDPSCEIDQEYTEQINYHAPLRFAAFCKKQGIKRFVFASSCSVYGAGYDELLNEKSPLYPVSLYAKSKANFEEKLIEMSDSNFRPTCLRQATLFGYSPRMRFDLAVNMMTMHALINKRIIVMGKGNQWRPFLHVQDSANAFIKTIESPIERVGGEIFNVGTINLQIHELASEVKAHIGQNIAIEVAPDNEDKRNYHVDFSKFERTTGFQPLQSIKNGVLEISGAIRDKIISDPSAKIYYNIEVIKQFIETPAVEGGKPASDHFIHFALPSIGKEEEDEVIDTLRSNWITMGPKVSKFEAMIAEYVGARHAIAVDSCTSALHLSLVGLGIGEGDEVITTPITWPATANVIIHQKAKPVFVDIDVNTLNIDPDKIEKKITSRTKAIIPVHMAGLPCDMDRIRFIAEKYKLVIIEDAAHALGAVYSSRKIGTISKATCFSFYPIKNITTVEGGALTTNDDSLAEKIRVLRLHGVVKDAWKRYSDSGYVEMDTIYPGYKYNMTDVEASLGMCQLKKIDSFIEVRERYSQLYSEAFKNIPEITPINPKPPSSTKHARHLYIILLNLERLKIMRNQFIDCLKQENIGAGVHFKSLHLQTYYKDAYALKADFFPNANSVSERAVSLPLYPKMSDRDVHNVIFAVRKITNAFKK